MEGRTTLPLAPNACVDVMPANDNAVPVTPESFSPSRVSPYRIELISVGVMIQV